MSIFDLWDDTKFAGGANWETEIKNAIESAAAVILLVSADFLASSFIVEHELPQLLLRAESVGTTILPVILSPCPFMDSKLSKFPSLNPPYHPVSRMTMHEQDMTWSKLADIIFRKVTENFKS